MGQRGGGGSVSVVHKRIVSVLLHMFRNVYIHDENNVRVQTVLSNLDAVDEAHSTFVYFRWS